MPAICYATVADLLVRMFGNYALDVLQELNSGWELSQQRAIDLRFELRDSMAEEEWAALFVVESPSHD